MNRVNKALKADMKENQEILPDYIKTSLSKLGVNKQVQLAISGDITPQNTYGKCWLIVTDTHVLSYCEGQEDPLTSILLRDIEGVEASRNVGNIELVLKVAGRTVKVLRFTNTLMSKVNEATKTLLQLTPKAAENHKESKKTIGKPSEEQKRCPKCGRLIPDWSAVCPACISKRKVFLRLLGYIRPYLHYSIAGLFLAMVLTAVGLAPPYLTKILIDDAIGTGNYELLTFLAIALAGVYLSTTIFGAARSYILQKLGQKIMLNIRKELYEHLQVLSLSFYDRMMTGGIMSRVVSDTERVQEFVTFGFQRLLIDVLNLIFIGAILFTMNWELAVIVLVPTPVLVVGTLFFSRKIHGVYHKAWRRWASLNTILADKVPGVIVVKAFAQEFREKIRFNRVVENYYDSYIRIIKLGQIFPAMGFIVTLGSTLLWWFGGQQILGGTLTLGVLIAFITYTGQFYQPVQNLSMLSRTFLRASTSAERIFEVLDTSPEISDRQNALILSEIAGCVKFENVSFAYKSGETVLRNINFEIQPGETVGLVGPSGAGKTTLAKLLLRFYDPTQGRITVDGNDLRDVKKKSLREQVGIVLQDPFLFSGSIAQNILYGNPEASQKEIIEAAKAANIHDFILSLPEGYDTEVGERGHRLSGGEKQRVSIARALLKNPKILILDEATSSVDTETESKIQQALSRLMENRTSIVIAHRLSTVKNSDLIVVLDKGDMVEKGKHEKLLQSDGLYSRLCEMQASLTRIKG
jgi:ATP-binding cassette subfamily B protein